VLYHGCVLTLFPRFFFLSVVLSAASSHLYAEKELPDFTVGLGYGLLNEKSLVNIDLKINMPVNDYLSSQLLLNSNYLVTGSTKSSFAQSELSSNWFISNDHGRMGLGLGVNELEPMDENLETDRKIIGQFIGDLFLNSFSLTANYVSDNASFSNITSSRIGVSYYLNDDHRISVYQEEHGGRKVRWRLETYLQPKKHDQMWSLGIILRARDDVDYVGFVIQHYFDHAVTLKQRERE
jgi:hypothetical protein